MTITTPLDAPAGAASPAPPPTPAPSAPVASPPTGPPPVITPNRRRVDGRFRTLAFNIRTQGRPYFEVLLATDRSLFDPAASTRRTPAKFYAGRQDGGLLNATAGETAYVVPAVVLKRFAEARPRASEIFYTVAVYETPDGAPLLAQPAAVLSTMAPSVLLGGDFQADAMAAVLSVPVEKLQPVDAMPPGAEDPAPPQAYAAPGIEDPAAAVATEASAGDPATMSFEGEAGAPVEMPPDAAMEAGFYGELADVEPLDGAPHEPQAHGYEDGYDVPQAYESDPDEERVAAEYGADDEGYDEPYGAEDDVDESYGDPEAYGAGDEPYPEPEADAAGVAYEDGYEDAPVTESAWAEPAESSFPPGAAEPAQLADVDEDRVDEELAAASGWDEPYDVGDYGAFGNGHGNGNGAAALAEPPPPAPAMPAPAAPAAGTPLDIPGKIGIVTKIGRKFEAPDGFRATRADAAGLRYGFVGFAQDSGMLGRLLTMMRERDPAKFAEVFGPQADELLRVTCQRGPASHAAGGGRSARLQPVGVADLWQEPWLSRFVAAGAHPPFQAAQNEFAVRAFVDPMLGFAAAFGMNTERALAMVCDRAVQQGPNGARRWLTGAIGPIRTDALRQQALGALGLPGVREFQQASGLRADGAFGAITHAALVARLRQLGPASPVPIPTRDQNMDAIVMRADAENAVWKARPRTIRTDPEFADAELAWTSPAAGGRR